MKQKYIHAILYVLLGVVVIFLGAALLLQAGDDDEIVDEIIEVGDEVSFEFVSGTEYVPTDPGQVIVELRDRQYDPINATCYVSILYPNKTFFVNHTIMVKTISIGTQYYNFSTPAVVGVFEYSANCTYQSKTYVAGQSFHVSKGRLRAWIEK